jgi:hypothetical protein
MTPFVYCEKCRREVQVIPARKGGVRFRIHSARETGRKWCENSHRAPTEARV